MKKLGISLSALAAALLMSATVFVQAVDADEEGWTSLFNGKNLDGWKMGDADQGKWTVKEGKIVAQGPRSHIFTDKNFKNFEFKAEVMTTPGSNSGIYFHTKYLKSGWPEQGHESQVNVTHGDPVKTGSLYHYVKLFETPAEDNKWWEHHIIVRGKHLITKINGKVVLDYTEPEGAAGAKVINEGCFALQAHDPKSITYYRNIRVKKLED